MYTEILVPLSGSRKAEHGVGVAIDFARLSGARIHLLHVVSCESALRDTKGAPTFAISPTLIEMSVSMTGDLLEVRERRARRYLRQYASSLRSGGNDVICAVWRGTPGREINEYAASTGIDLIVMTQEAGVGLSGLLGRLRSFPFGTTVGKVQRAAVAPVLIVPVPRNRERRMDARTSARDDDLDLRLTPREREVLQLVASGHSNLEIAEALMISRNTAVFHVANILEKTKSKNRTGAVKVAARAGVFAAR